MSSKKTRKRYKKKSEPDPGMRNRLWIRVGVIVLAVLMAIMFSIPAILYSLK